MDVKLQLRKDLNEDIRNYINEYGQKASSLFWLKTILLLCTWGGLYTFLIFYSPESKPLAFGLAMVWGFCSLLIIFNIGHDAAHGVISSKRSVNNILQYTFNLVGANAYSWKMKHNIAHHVHTNIEGMDFDTDLSPIMRLSPHTPYRKQYKWQHLTVFVIYPLLSLLIISVADFKIFFQTKNAGLVIDHPKKEWVILIFSKIYYLILIVIIPQTFGGYSLCEVLTAFLSFQFLNGIVIALVFMPSHYFIGSMFYNHRPENYSWLEHQISTTMDLSPNNRFISFLLGGLNLNISHHLYANFCHTHYFNLSRVIKKRLDQHNVHYNEMTYPKALIAHYKFLLKLKYDLV